MAHVQVLIVPKDAPHWTEGVRIEADLTQGEVDKVSAYLDDAFAERLIDDFGIDPVGPLADYREVIQKASQIIGRKR